jgi:hypothetical protein
LSSEAECPKNPSRVFWTEANPNVSSRAYKQEAKERVFFWRVTTHYLLFKAFPLMHYYHLARNILKYYVFTDGFPPLTEEGMSVSKQ